MDILIQTLYRYSPFSNSQIPAMHEILVTDIGSYVRFESCNRRFKLRFKNEEIARQLPHYYLMRQTLLDPVLQETGRKREEEWEASLSNYGLVDLTANRNQSLNNGATSWLDFSRSIASLSLGQSAFGREIEVEGHVGAFVLKGRIDFVIIRWVDGQPILRLVECKASRKDQTYQRIQIALYRLLVSQLLQEGSISIAGLQLQSDQIECVVVRIDEQTNTIEDALQKPSFNLETETADLLRLTAADGALNHTITTDLADIPFQLDGKCNDCIYSVHCLTESARERRLELLGLEPTTIRVLRNARVNTLDELAALDSAGPQAATIRKTPGFTENLDRLSAKAKTRLRKLPSGNQNIEAYDVESLSFSGQGQLPLHEINGQRLVRVYLTVEYDYVENRLVALVAHVTNSPGQLRTGFSDRGGRWQPTPIVQEQVGDSELQALRGEDVVCKIETQWTGDYTADTQTERELIERFFREVTTAIAATSDVDEAPIHFYLWSRQEMTRLIEGCTRASSTLLAHLQELLGCRESLEQMIYSSLQDEVDHRFALAWSGRDLAVVSTLRWFGQRFHWRRLINGQEVNLDHAFRQDLFDFKINLPIDSRGQWLEDSPLEHEFEIRWRYLKSLSVPYWRAYWGTLPDPNDSKLETELANAIRRYQSASQPNYLQEYLRARSHFLRWIEERIRFKNVDIVKPLINIPALQNFSLEVNTIATAAIDFLQLDYHIKRTNWIADHLVPPIYRIPSGRTMPVSNVRVVRQQKWNIEIEATIDLSNYDLDYEVFKAGCTIENGDFLRLTPCHPQDPRQGQTIGQLLRAGSTCVVQRLDWERRLIRLSVMIMKASAYLFSSYSTPSYDSATLDESPSEFIAGKVEKRLSDQKNNSVCQWLDPTAPAIPALPPLPPETLEQCQRFLDSFQVPATPSPYPLAADQQAAILEGLEARIQLLQGPPGTGKTETTAIATFLRVLARRKVGDVILIAAPTHTAVDTLLLRLNQRLPALQDHATALGLVVLPIRLIRLDPKEEEAGKFADTSIVTMESAGAPQLKQHCSDAVIIVGGTTNGLLKAYRKFRQLAATLIIDEASMLVFPHFLALATLIQSDGEILLAGDHRQLSPIVAHDWEDEDRPPVLLYQPFVSAYQAVDSLKTKVSFDGQIRRSALSFTFRLPSIIRELIAQLYELDGITLRSRGSNIPQAFPVNLANPWSGIWSCGGLYLVLHSERESKKSNPLEVGIIEQILAASPGLRPDCVAVVTPHRTQRTLLKTRLAPFRSAIKVIDTVERLQGGECPTIIVSATASDPTAIAKNVEFILDLNRSNVAFSRPQERLIVVCSRTLVEYIPADVENYQETMLWKALRSLCSKQVANVALDGKHSAEIFIPNSGVTEKSLTGEAVELNILEAHL